MNRIVVRTFSVVFEFINFTKYVIIIVYLQENLLTSELKDAINEECFSGVNCYEIQFPYSKPSQ